MSRHQGAKIAHWTWRHITYIGVLDILEFAVWVGMPLFMLFAADQMYCIAKLHRKSLDKRGALSLSLLTIVLLMAFAGRTVAETGRLWIFIVPLVCLSAGAGLLSTFRNRPRAAALTFATLQLVTVLMTKLFHDFY